MATNVSGPLRLVTDQPATLVQVMVRAPKPRPHAGGMVVDFTTPATVTDGVVEFPCVPGPAVLMVSHAGVPQITVPLVVPDKASASLEECMQAAGLADNATQSVMEDLARRIVEGVAAAEVSASAAAESAAAAESDRQEVVSAREIIDGYRLEVTTARGETVAARDTAVDAAETATAQANLADAKAGEAAASAAAAEESETSAAASAQTATEQATTSTTQAGIATEQAGVATGAAQTATEQAQVASSAAVTATEQAGVAAGHADTAGTSAAAAAESEKSAKASKQAAAESETSVKASEDRVATIAGSTRWVGTKLEVNGVLSPDLKGDLPVVYSTTPPEDKNVIWVNPDEDIPAPTHAIGDVGGLQSALDGKVSTSQIQVVQTLPASPVAGTIYITTA